MTNNKPSTYLDHAIASVLDEQGGRFAKSAPTIVGAGMQYPRLPEDHPSNQHAKVPDEPPLVWSVNEQLPVGERFELEQSPPPPSCPSPVVEAKPPTSLDPDASTVDPEVGVAPVRSDGVPLSTSLNFRWRA